MLLAMALLALTLAGMLWWKRSHVSSPTTTLEPVAATTSILVPAEPDTAASSVAAKAPDTQASAPAVLEPKEEGPAPQHSAIEQLTSRVAALEDTDRTQTEQITALRAAIDQVTAARQIESDKAVERARPAVQANATPARRSGRATSAASSSAQATAAVLAVDLWGGQPSVVVGKEGAGSTEVRFISQGETQGRVTLKRADVANQRATFTTPTGEFTMSAGER